MVTLDRRFGFQYHVPDEVFCRISPFTAGMWDNGRATPFEFSEVSIHIYRVLGEISEGNGVVFLPRSLTWQHQIVLEVL